MTTVRAQPSDQTEPSVLASAFWRYWAASATSTTGDGITTVALPLVAILLLDASNFEVGVITAANYAAIVLIGLPAGVLVGRFALRRLQVTMDGVRALVIASIPLAAWWDVLTLAHVLTAAFVIGLAGNLFDVANATFVPRVVPRSELTKRNGLLSGTFATTQMVGPALGGLLVQAVGAAYSLLVDAATYIVSAVLLGRIPEPGKLEQAQRESDFLRQLAAGVAYVVRHPIMRPNMIAATAVNFANGALLAVTPPFLVRELGVPVGFVGLVIAIEGVGSIVAAVLVARIVGRLGDARTLLLATLFGPAVGILMPLAVGPAAVVIFAIGMAGLAAGVTVLSVVARTHRQMVSPADMLSRVMASVRFISWGAIPLGALLGGAASQVSSPRAGLAVVAVAALGAPLATWSSRVRVVRRLEDA